MSSTKLTGRWIGHYHQSSEEYPITADFLEAEEHLSGFMYDGKPDRDYSVFQIASEAGLPPGADEQIEAQLRQRVPDAPAAPIRYVTRLPPNSILRGRRTGETISFLKAYQGTAVSGYQVGNQLVGIRKAGHEVHYEGRLSPDGLVIEGRWWIDADPDHATPMCEGLFHLRRSDAAEPPDGQEEKTKRPWWRFWS
jgi:hypothetical protein